MTDHEMIESSRNLVTAIDAIADSKGLDGGDRAALATMALSELLARWLGPVGAVERMRDVADLLERQTLAQTLN